MKKHDGMKHLLAAYVAFRAEARASKDNEYARAALEDAAEVAGTMGSSKTD